MITIGERLKYLRKENGLTLEQVGEKLGSTKVTISRFENNVRVPTSEPILQLSKLYNVSTDYLYCLTNERERVNNEKYVIKDNYLENIKEFIKEEVQIEKDGESFTEEDMNIIFNCIEAGIKIILSQKSTLKNPTSKK